MSQKPPTDLTRHFADPYPAYAQVREHRLIRDQRGAWYVAGYEDVEFVLKDRRFGKQPPPGTEGNLPAGQDRRDRRSILNADPPDHTRLRGLVARAFSAPRVEAMRPAIQRLVDSILDGVEARGRMELVREFAFPIPATVISDMLGIPQADRARFAGLSNDIIAFGSGVRPDLAPDVLQRKAHDATAAFDRYLEELFELKRDAREDDLTTALIRAEDEDGKLSADELTQNVRLLFMAGHETTEKWSSACSVAPTGILRCTRQRIAWMSNVPSCGRRASVAEFTSALAPSSHGSRRRLPCARCSRGFRTCGSAIWMRPVTP